MTMVFYAANLTMLNAVKAGGAIRFVPGRVNRQFTLTKIEKGK